MEIFFVFFSFSVFLVPVVLLIVYIVKTHALERRIAALEQQLTARGAPIAEKPTQVPVPPPSTQQPLPPPTPAPAPLQQTAQPTVSPSALNIPPAMKSAPARSQQEWELLVGGTWLNRIGAFALILAVGFFLKYAFDKEWINEPVRVLIGAAAGAVCLVLGGRARKKDYVIFAQGLIGAGISILYLSVYASFTLYQLVPQWIAFLLMSGVTVLGLAQALSYDSFAVSLLSWSGGFLTPVMLSTGQSNEVALFTYLTLLSLGLLAVVVRKESWASLELLTLVALYVMYVAWYEQYYVVEKFGVTLFFLLLFFLLFYGFDLVRMKIPTKQFPGVRHTAQLLSATFFYIALYILLDELYHNALVVSTLALAVVYGGTVAVAKRYVELEQEMEYRYSLVALTFVAVATAIQFGHYATVRLWSLEALAILWIAGRYQWRHFLAAAVALFALDICYLLFAPGSVRSWRPEEFVLLLNDRAATYGVVIATCGAGAYVANGSFLPAKEKVTAALGVGMIMLLFIFLTVETNDYFRFLIKRLSGAVEGTTVAQQMSDLENLRQLTTSTVWLVYSIMILVIGIWKGFRSPRIVAMGLFALSILKIFLFDLSFLETLYRIFSFLALGLILLAVSYLYQRYRSVLFPAENGKPRVSGVPPEG